MDTAIQQEYKNFVATTVPLGGSNLIEASAGTGKTYSIAILVLRLLIEKRLSLKEILMVTFTRAAVAELEERIRLFVRSAYKASVGEKISDETIHRMVTNAIEESEDDGVEIKALLHSAVLLLDETSVMTIHSFCQNTLTEFAFETRQIFGAETMEDSAALMLEEVHKFWRKEITIIPVSLLTRLVNAGLNPGSIYCIVKAHLEGKKFLGFDPAKTYGSCKDDHERWISELGELQRAEEELNNCLLEKVQKDREEIIRLAQANAYARKVFSEDIQDPAEIIRLIADKRKSQYAQKLFGPWLADMDQCSEASERIKQVINRIIDHLYCIAISDVMEGIRHYKLKNNVLAFDDMIVNLHHAISSGNPGLVSALRKKYKAVFIDEFQDTDRLQYEIFSTAFGESTILFYIGDPKQSIYAWRKADIFTYFKARSEVNNYYGMNYNFRSSSSMIAAMNLFFEVDDAFYFRGFSPSIDYIKVETPPGTSKGLLLRNGQEVTPITYSEHGKKSEILEAMADHIAGLFNEGYEIQKGENARKVKPSDIGILVRSNREARNAKAALARYSIPAVTIGDDKILKSGEALYLLYLLQAMETVSVENINRALLSPFTGMNSEAILKLDEEQVIAAFRKYRSSWEENGIYSALMQFVADFKVRQILLQRNAENGERVITNLFQLIELVHKVQTHRVLSPLELVSWLKRGIDGMLNEGDEFEQRVENDEEAVKIVTIHASKGLEYNIVFVPFLDLLPNKMNGVCSFRDPESGDYISGEKSALTEAQLAMVAEQEEQENRRLIYVAITRAVYKCYIYKNIYKHYNSSSLVPFYKNVREKQSPLAISFAPSAIPSNYRYKVISEEKVVDQLVPRDFQLLENNWRRISYSALSAKPEPVMKKVLKNYSGEYDEFVFNTLGKGVNTGNMLHFILENIHFGDQGRWSYFIEQAVKKYAPLQQEQYSIMLKRMLEQVMNVEINTGEGNILLSRIEPGLKIHEFEFDFTLPEINVKALLTMAEGGMQLSVKQLPALQGIMNGKIDLFFEYNGKYYVLDWKSNFLGDSIEDYNSGALMDAMNENNYHLQYLIYTVAVKKYLESRVGPSFDFNRDFGGVIYLFVRGIRVGRSEGIFIARPTSEQMEKIDHLLSGASV